MMIEKRQTFPLSYSQMGILMTCRRMPDSTAFQLPSAIPFTRGVDADRLVAALHEVIRCRPVLHTRLVLSDDKEPRQYSDSEMRIDVPCHTMTEAEATIYIINGFVRPFTLFGPLPLCRFEVIVTEQHTWLLMDFHHIIADGVTISHLLMGRDLPAAYEGAMLETDGYMLYEQAEEEQRLLGSREYLKAKDYYQQLFYDTNFSVLPLGKTGISGIDLSFSHYFSRKELDGWCEQHQVAPNLLFMAAFSIVLSKWCHQSRVAFATLSHGRNSRRLRQAYGMFVKTVPFVTDVVSDTRILDYVKNLRAPLMSSVRHAAYPYIHFCRDQHQTAEVSFAFQGGEILEEVCVGGDAVVGRQLRQGMVNNDLSCVVYTHDQQYELRLDASAGRREESELQLFARSMDICLRVMMQHPTRRVEEIELVDEEEKKWILAHSQGEVTPSNNNETLISMIDAQTARTPQATAVSDGTEKLTYAQFQQQSCAVAHWLSGQGVKQGDFVGVWGAPCCGFVTAVIGVMRQGAAYVPLDPSWPESYSRQIISEAGIQVTLHPEHLPDVIAEEGNVPIDATSPEGLAYMIFTSGTTGRAKGVMIPHRALTNLIHFIVRRWHLDARSRISCHSSLAFDASVEDLYPVLTVGGTVYLMPQNVRLDVRKIHQYIDEHQITGGCYTTQLGQMIADHPHPSLDYICLGGEQMTLAPSADCRIINTYGPTEYGVDATYYELQPDRTYNTIPIGRPVDNTLAIVVDQHGRLLPWGVVGELYLSGVQMAVGYWHSPSPTAAKFTKCSFSDDAAFHTGDLARWNSEGLLEYVGRLDHLVKVNGYRVSLEEVERQIALLPHVTSVCVTAYAHVGHQQLCAYYTTDEEVDEKTLAKMLRTNSPSYMIPSSWIHLQEMPLLYNGKIDRRQLPPPISLQPQDIVAPQTDTQRMVCHAYAHVLQKDQVGIDDDFFNLGGSSLTAMTLMEELEKSGCVINYGSVFQYPTPRLLSHFLEHGGEMKEYHIDGDDRLIRQYLERASSSALDDVVQPLVGDVLLTGSTGYLGIHVLHELLESCQSHIYCIVRASSDHAALVRLMETYKFYFRQSLSQSQLARISVVAGDLTEDQCLSLCEESGVSLVVNCAANVRHFAKESQLIPINTDSVCRLARFCEKTHARLVQISTLGIAGLYDTDSGSPTCLTEHRLHIGQHLGDGYTYSKYMAEKYLMERMARGELDAVIIRVGNLSPRSYDGQFQRNAEENSLMMALRLFAHLGMIPESASDIRFDLSPVDIVARAVLRLAALVGGQPVWHVASPHLHALQEILAERGYEVRVVDDAVFHKRLEQAKADSGMSNLALSAVAYGAMAGSRKPNVYDSAYTAEVLQRLGVEW